MLKHVIVGIVSLLWVASVGAETLTVCLDGSCDYTDIQSAVDASEDGCVISVAAGTYYESQGSGLLPTINTYEKNVVIQGSVDSTGYPTTIVRHSDAYGVCIVSNGASGDGVLFRDLLVVRSSLRGAVSLSNSTASFENCVLGRSVVFASSGETQLIRAENSQVTCDDCLLTANHAEWGAAISVHGGSLACTATVFQFNQMNILSALEYGGALTAVDAEVSLSDCQFIGNESQVSGAAVALKNCSTVVAGCTFEANKVISSVSPDGGAVYHSQGELQLIDTTFTGNEALYTSCGGAVCSRSGVLLIERCLFESNSADQQGGAVSAGSNSVFRVSQSRFFSNQSFEGGAIHAANPAGLELVDSVVSGNDALNGGGLYLYGVNSSLHSNLICGNTSANISGLFEDAGGNQIFDECSQVTFTVCAEGCHYQDVSEAVGAAPPGSTIQLLAETYALSETINPSGKSLTLLGTTDPGNGVPTSVLDGQGQFRILLCDSGEQIDTVFENIVIQNGLGTLDSTPITGWALGGGGLFVGSSPLLTNCHFKENAADRGGGLFVHAASSPTLNACTFETNTAALLGGGLYSRQGSEPNLIDCTFVENTAVYGGAFYIFESSPRVTGALFDGNEATGVYGGGGGMYVNLGAPVIDDCTFVANVAPGTPKVSGDGFSGGGALFIIESEPVISGTRFSSNSSEFGGAVYIETGQSGSFLDCVFDDNSADLYGGAVASEGGGLFLNSSFTENTSGFYGGAFSCLDSAPTLEFCEITSNTAPIGGGIYCTSESNPVLVSTSVCGNTPLQIVGPWINNGGSSVLNECLSEICQADINGDLVVDGSDLSVLLGYWGLVYNPADLNSDGEINGADLAILLSLWGDCDG